MSRVTMDVSAGLMFAAVVLAGGIASAAPAEPAAKPKCLKAEVNPVTGHVLCIDPLGAAVEPRPPEAALTLELQPELHARDRGDVSRLAGSSGSFTRRKHRLASLIVSAFKTGRGDV